MAFGLANAIAQTPIFNTSLGIDHPQEVSKRGIIREQGISYYEHHKKGFFVYLPALSGGVNIVEMPEGWFVRDFRVVDSIAYFCGIDSVSTTALLGHFNIKNLQGGTGSVLFQRDTGIKVKMAILNRIAVSKTNNIISVMTIGKESRGFNPDMEGADRVVYIDNYSAPIGSIFTPSNSNELFWDVVRTENYFVTSGTSGFSSSNLIMRRAQINLVPAAFQSDFIGGIKYDSIINFESGVRATNLINDSIVMAAYINKVGESRTAMSLYTIDVYSANMDYRQDHNTLISYTGARMLPPRDMVYLPDYYALMVIDTNSMLSRGNTHILRLTPYLTSAVLAPWTILYIAPFYYYYDCPTDFNSLIDVSANSSMAAAGANWLNLDLSGVLPPENYTNNCVTTRNTDCFVRKKFGNKTFAEGRWDSYDRPLSDTTIVVQLGTLYPCPPEPLQQVSEIGDELELFK